MAGHEVLGEGLRPFELRSRGTGPETLEPGSAEPIHNACDQGIFGAGDGQCDAVLAGETKQPFEIVCSNGDILAAGFPGGARIAGGHEDPLDPCRPRCRPGQGVFAAAASYDQYLHFTILTLSKVHAFSRLENFSSALPGAKPAGDQPDFRACLGRFQCRK